MLGHAGIGWNSQKTAEGSGCHERALKNTRRVSGLDCRKIDFAFGRQLDDVGRYLNANAPTPSRDRQGRWIFRVVERQIRTERRFSSVTTAATSNGMSVRPSHPLKRRNMIHRQER